MDEILEQGGDFPVGKFVHVDAPFVLDQFATGEHTINGFTSEENCYYYVLLNSFNCIVVKAASVDHIAALDKTQQETLDFLDKKISTFDDIPLEGKLVELKEQKLVEFFDEYSKDYGFLDADSAYTPRYYMIDMTAVRAENVLLYIVLPVGAVAGLITVAVLIAKSRKKKAEAAAAFSAQG